MTSLLDRLYANQSNKRLFFRQGWGDLALLWEALRRGFTLPEASPIRITWDSPTVARGVVVRQGAFPSPFSGAGLPDESRTAYVELVLPEKAPRDIPICLHFAATGDEGFRRRRIALALPLIHHGIGSLILENPFYGRRRPPGQHGKMLNVFSDLWTMGGATVQEGLSLMGWLMEAGFSRVGVCGISMGGHMAAQVGSLAPVPTAIVACITPHSASAVFTEGILKGYLAWDVLDRQAQGLGEAHQLARDFLNLTDIRNYPVPVRPEAAYLVAAGSDAYIPPASAETLHRHWRGSNMQWLRTGHVGAFLFHRSDFLKAIRQAFSRL